MSAVSPAPAALAAELYERHGGRVLRFCRGRLGSPEEAEDAAQATFLNAVRALGRGTVPQAEAAWLLRIAENVCHGRHRSAARRPEAACDPTVLEDVVEAAPGRPDELIHLAEALESLPERQRRAVLLREWQGLSYDEIGDSMGLSHSAVETLLFRARRKLADALEHDGRPRRARGLSLAPLLGWAKTAAGGAGAAKVAAAAIVAAGAVVLPVRDVPPPPAAEQGGTPVARAPAPLPAARAASPTNASAPAAAPARRAAPAPAGAAPPTAAPTPRSAPARPQASSPAAEAPAPDAAPVPPAAPAANAPPAAPSAVPARAAAPLSVSVPVPDPVSVQVPALPTPTVPDPAAAPSLLPVVPELPTTAEAPAGPSLPLPALP